MNTEIVLYHPNILRIICLSSRVQANLKICKLAWLSPFLYHCLLITIVYLKSPSEKMNSVCLHKTGFESLCKLIPKHFNERMILLGQ